MLAPAIPAGATSPAAASIVGATSILATTCSTTVPAGNSAGQRTSIGTRIDSS